ncbi:hypothetical protein O6H91_Y319900 [Diphasiastrum complanatum]|nr:hypothetical protein O6H91_Y319900 [Diphasiastrum complanatum]
MPSATSPSVFFYLTPTSTSAVIAGRSGLSLFCPRLPSSDVWQQLGVKAKNNAPALRRRYSLQLVTSKLTSRLTSSARARELMRMNQQRDAKPALPGPKGIPSTVPVGITNILPINIPTHPNAPKPAYVMVVSASGDPTKIGDCPFSQRVLMTLEEKHLPYEGRFIDVENKPTWYMYRWFYSLCHIDLLSSDYAIFLLL